MHFCLWLSTFQLVERLEDSWDTLPRRGATNTILTFHLWWQMNLKATGGLFLSLVFSYHWSFLVIGRTRQDDSHRQHVAVVLSACTRQERDQLESEYGVQYSELLRLPYY